MKIDRLIGILSILLQEEKTTAPELAEKFEVSRRTINRDIEDLCKAGIPVQTVQGSGGGIRIMDSFKMDRTLLTSKEMQMITAGLRSLDSVSGSNNYGQLMEKISAGSSEFIGGRDSILIDLSSWNKDDVSNKISMIQDAIGSRNLIRFRYLAPKGNSTRTIEPYYLIFKWSSWYVWGWCRTRKDYRLFKLNRLDGLLICADRYEPRRAPLPDLDTDKIFKGTISARVIIDADEKWRLVEDFGSHCFEEMKDGRLLFDGSFSDEDALITWLLSFEDKAELVEPENMRDEMKKVLNLMQRRYNKQT